jgi:hypothetical protein
MITIFFGAASVDVKAKTPKTQKRLRSFWVHETHEKHETD